MKVSTVNELYNALKNDTEVIKVCGEAKSKVTDQMEKKYANLKLYYYLDIPSDSTGLLLVDLVLGGMKLFSSKKPSQEEQEITESMKLIKEWYHISGEGNSYIEISHNEICTYTVDPNSVKIEKGEF